MGEMNHNQTKEVLGVLSKKYFTLKESNRELESQKKSNNGEIAIIQSQILQIMESSGLTKFGTDFGTLTSKIDLYPNIKDFAKFITWVYKTRGFEFLQKRANAAPIREMLKNANMIPPGIENFEKETLLGRINPQFRSELENVGKGEQ